MFAIVAAMDEELRYIYDVLECSEQVSCGPFIVTKGVIDKTQVVVAKLGVGKVNASMVSTSLLNHFALSAFINIGSAGGVASTLKVGDVVISTDVFQHDVDAVSLGFARGQIPFQQDRFFSSDSSLRALAKHKVMGVLEHSKVYEGMIGSGDQFINDAAKVAELLQIFPNMLAVDMEAAAVAQVCAQFHIPFLVIRSISDAGDENAHLSFPRFLDLAAKNASLSVRAMLRAFEKGS
jgi:adenosylhomocysteine nucleosidase